VGMVSVDNVAETAELLNSMAPKKTDDQAA
jgi:hypothetical protein